MRIEERCAVRCDLCGRTQSVTRDRDQARAVISKLGWSELFGGRHHCPACVEIAAEVEPELVLGAMVASLRACGLASSQARSHTPATMPILAVAGQKGGTGKTTLAVNVAAELEARGERVLLVDADPQGTALTWAAVAAENNAKVPTTIAMGDNLRAQLPATAEGYAWCVIDSAGRGGKRQVGALMVADVALLPCGPSPADAWALAESLELVAQVRELRPELRVALVMNRVDRSAIGASTRAAIAELRVPVLRATIGERVAFREALGAGLGVTRYATGSVAANELRRLVDELEQLAAAAPGDELVAGEG